MFSAWVVAADPDRCQRLRALAFETRHLMFFRQLDSYPDSRELGRLLTVAEPEVVLLDLSDEEAAQRCATQIRERCPLVAIVGFRREGLPPAASLTAVVATQVPPAPSATELSNAIEFSLRALRSRPEENLLAFVPAKAGSGTSTIVLNTAAALAELRKQCLVIEGDLRCGVLSLMLNVTPPQSVQELLLNIGDLDMFRVQSAAARVGAVDLLMSSRNPAAALPSWEAYFRLIEIVKARYDVILTDLPELVNQATEEIVRRARFVFVVSTAEALSLKLAAMRCGELRAWGVAGERIRVLLNRWQTLDISPEGVEKEVGYPVAQVFPNDYRSVQKAIREGRSVAAETRLAKAFVEFASLLTGSAVPESFVTKFKKLFR